MAIVYSCPACHKHVSVDHPNPEGRRFRCSHCATIFRAQGQPAATSSPAGVASSAAVTAAKTPMTAGAPAAAPAKPPAPAPPAPPASLPARALASPSPGPAPAAPKAQAPAPPPVVARAPTSPPTGPGASAANRPSPTADPQPSKPSAPVPKKDPAPVKGDEAAATAASRPKPEPGVVKPGRLTFPGTERAPAPATPSSKPGQSDIPPAPVRNPAKDTYAGDQKIEELHAAAQAKTSSGKDTHPGSQKVEGQPGPAKQTYAGNQKIEETQKTRQAPSSQPRPSKPTFSGTGRSAFEHEIEEPLARDRAGRETFPGNQKAEELPAEAAPVKRPRPSKPGLRQDVPAGTPLACPACRNIMKLALAAPLGRTIKCPSCSQPVPVCWPDAETERAAAAFESAAKEAAAPALAPAAAKPPAAPAPPVAKKLPILAITGGGLAVIGIAILSIVFLLGERAIPESAWMPFTAPGGLCELHMPGKPVLQANKGTQGGATQYYVRRPEMNATFVLSYVTLPGGLTPVAFQDIYQSERQQTLQASGGTLRGEQDLTWNGHLCKEVVIAAADGRLIAQRLFLVEGPKVTRLFILEASGRWRAAGQGPAARFFESLKLPPRGSGNPPEPPPD